MQPRNLDLDTKATRANSSPSVTGLLSDAEVERLGALNAEYYPQIKQAKSDKEMHAARDRVRHQVEERLKTAGHPWADVWAHAVAYDYILADAKYRVMLDWFNGWVSRIEVKRAFDRFIKVERRGAGGFGVVFKAFDPKRGDWVAVKVPHVPPGQMPSDRNTAASLAQHLLLIFEEARKHAEIHVQGCVPLHDSGMPVVSESGQTLVDQVLAHLRDNPIWFSMQLIEGRSLKDVLVPTTGCYEPGKTMSDGQVIKLMISVAEIVKRLHATPTSDGREFIIYKDLKPANILLDQHEDVWLTDFGLASARFDQQVTGNPFSGTFLYAAPEQFAGIEANEQTDIWAWGVIFYELLTGQLPFDGPDRICNELSPVPKLRVVRTDLRKRLELIIDRCLQRDRGKRFGSFAEVLDELKSPTLQYDDFRSFLNDVGRHFVGRGWLYDEVDAWTVHRDERAMVIKADYGVGKSAFIAHLICDERWNQRVLAWHCCRYDERKTLDPAWFIQNLSAMLANRCPDFAEQLDSDSVREGLVRRHDDPTGAFKDAIIEPLKRISPPSDGVRYLVIDALDEALGWSGRSRSDEASGHSYSIVQVLAAVADHFPEWLRLVATTRGEPRVLEPLGRLRTHTIDAESQSNLEDLHEYVGLRLATPNLLERLAAARQSAECMARVVVEKSEGKFLYAQLVFEALERDNLTLADIDSLPPGLPGLYESFFRRHFPTTDSYDSAKKVLTVLVASVGGEPLTRQQLAHASDLKRNLPTVLGSLTQYLRERDELVQFQHASLPEWLTQESRHPFSVEKRDGHAALAEMCRHEFSDDENEWSRYLLSYYPTHLIEASDEFENFWDELADVLCTFKFIETKAEAGMVFELKSDFERTRQCLPKRHSQRRLIELLDDAIGLDAQFIFRHPFTLFQCLWNRGWWYDTPEAAAHYEISASDRTSEHLPWNQRGPKLHKLLEAWREQKEQLSPGFCWLRSLRPSESLGQHRARDLLLRGHNGIVNNIAFSPNGAWIASASHDGTVRVWDTNTGQVVACLMTRELPKRRDRACGVVFSPNNRWIVCGATDHGEIQLWDLHTRVLRHAFPVPRASGECCVAFTADGERFAAVVQDTVKCWDVANCEELLSWKLPEGRTPASFSQDCKRLICSVDDTGLVMFDIEHRNVIARFCGHTDRVDGMAFSPNGTRIASGSWDKTIRIWDIATESEVACLVGHEGWVTSLAWSGDEKRLVTGAMDKTVRIWETATGRQLTCLAEHSDNVWDVKFSPDDATIASASGDYTVRIRDTVRAKMPLRLREHAESITGFAFSPDGKLLATAARNETTAWVWDVEAGAPRTPLEHPTCVFKAVFLPDGQRIATSCWDGRIRFWSIDGKSIESWDGHSDRCDLEIAISPCGQFLASWGDQKLRVWNLETRKEQFCLGPLNITQAAISPDGTRIAGGLKGDAVHVWRTCDGHEVAVLGKFFPAEYVTGIAFSFDGQWLAVGVSSNFVIWNLDTGEQLLRQHSGAGTVRSLSFSLDKKQLVVVSAQDNRLGLSDVSGTTTTWDIAQAIPVHQFGGAGDVIALTAAFEWCSVAFPLETAILQSSTGNVASWFPGTLERIQAARTGRNWAGVFENHLILFQLEGNEIRGATRGNSQIQWGIDNESLESDTRPTTPLATVDPPPRPVAVLSVAPKSVAQTIHIHARHTDGLTWHNDDYAGHAATCPICGRGGGYASGKGPSFLRVRFVNGEAESIDRPITELRIKCDGDCSVVSGSGLILLPNTHPEWYRERVREYLLSIGSPFASHPSLDEIPTESDLRSYFDWEEPLNPPRSTNTTIAPSGSAQRTPQQDASDPHDPPRVPGTPSQDCQLGSSGEVIMRGHEGAVYGAAFLPGGRGICSAGDDGTVRAWEIATGLPVFCKKGHSKLIYCLAVSPDGKRLATASWDHTIGLWRGANARLWKHLIGHSDTVYGVTFSPNGKLLASAAADCTVRIWESKSGREVGCLRGHSSSVVCVAFSPDGRLLASGGGDRKIIVWDLRSAKELKTDRGHTELVTQVRFSPDGKYIASASDDGTVRVRTISEKRKSRVLKGHDGWVLALAFSCDGNLLASGGRDGTIRIWNISTATESVCLKGHRGEVRSVEFSADGNHLLSASVDGTVRLWSVER